MKTTITMNRRSAAFLAIGLAAFGPSVAAAAETPDPSTVAMGLYDRVAAETAPKALAVDQIEYPRAAWSDNKEGWAVIKMDIDAEGTVSNVRLVEASNKRYFERHAIETVMDHTFRPATRDGKAVAVNDYKVRVRYELADTAE